MANDEERLKKLEDKMKQLAEQKKELLTRTKQKERKERTRKLIQIGAIFESMGINNIELAERFKSLIMDYPNSKQLLDKFLNDVSKK